MKIRGLQIRKRLRLITCSLSFMTEENFCSSFLCKWIMVIFFHYLEIMLPFTIQSARIDILMFLHTDVLLIYLLNSYLYCHSPDTIA